MNRIKGLVPLLAVAAAVFAAAVLTTPALAAPDTIYCLNGVSTTLPADITASSVSDGTATASFSEADALDVIANSGGSFYFGYYPGGEVPADWYWTHGTNDPTALEPGYTTNSVALGECTEAASAGGITHVSVCKMLERGDGTMGSFQQIAVAEWNNPNGPYFDASAANWVEGMGLTCDDPVALGYESAGYSVAWGGKQDPNHDAKAVRGSGFNNIYPYFTR